MKQTILRPAELAILRLIDLNAELAVPEIARRVRQGAPNVHRIINRLIERDILKGITAQIDFARIGLVEYGVNLAIATPTAREREKMVADLMAEPAVGWVADVGADYDCMFNVLSSSPLAVEQILARLSGGLKGAILRKELCLRIRRVRFERGIFGASGKRQPRFLIGNEPAAAAIDSLDRRILSLLSISNTKSFRVLARELEVSSSTFSRRVETLKERKIILGFSWHMNLAQCGVLQYRILLSLRTRLPALREKIFKIVQETPAIKMFADCLGVWDYELELDVWNAQQVKNVVAVLSEVCFGHLEKVSVIPIFQHRKFSSFPVQDR